MISVAVDRHNRIVRIVDREPPAIGERIVCITNEFSDLDKTLNDYVVVDCRAVYRPNIILIRLRAKKRCSEMFKVFYDTMFYNLDFGNEITPYEFNLNTSIRTEVIAYAYDNTKSTPVTDALAAGLGETDYHSFRIRKYDEIIHHDMVLADLTAQKLKMFALIDGCEDPETLHAMQFEFCFPSYSNMRWRV